LETEKLQILKMVQEGKVSVEEAAQLLEAVEPAKAAAAQAPKGNAQWLRVRVTDGRSGRAKVNVNVPIGLLSIATRFVKSEHLQGVDLNEIIRLVREGAHGKIVDVQDPETGEQVEIVIE
jgi:hypothetical protein